MLEGVRSDMTVAHVRGLTAKGLLRPLTNTEEWKLPSAKSMPSPPDSYVFSFARFHERGFGGPPHPFFRRLLHHYKLDL